MDAATIRELKPKLERFLSRFDACFSHSGTRGHLPIYVHGQLSDLPRKSVEPMALAAGVPPRSLQEFLSLLDWDHEGMRDCLQKVVAQEHASPHAIGIIDETSCVKQGSKTPGVQRQWCGSVGKKENCVVTVHLGYAVGDFHCLLDSELYLPQSWAQDRERCRQAGIPDDMDYRPKWQIALELLEQARANGVSPAWLTFDEGYGGKPPFLRALSEREQRYVAEVPRNFHVWIKPPRATARPFHRGGRGSGRKTPRLLSGSRPPLEVVNLLRFSPEIRDQPWKPYRVKDGSQGPMIWEAKHLLVYPKDESGLPGTALHLVIARPVLKPAEIKYFVSNAPAATALETLLLVAFSRWHVERCFEDQKTELGFDHFEGRKYIGLKRHQAITAVSHLFLSQVHQDLGEKNTGTHCVSGAHRRGSAGAELVADGLHIDTAAGEDCRHHSTATVGQCQSPSQPYQKDTPKTTLRRHSPRRNSPMRVERKLAL
jgi:SRSO17 transposase